MEPFPEEQDEEKPPGSRVIVHLDLDCFYAQVEMLRNPELRAKPLGVRQKSIVTTCNYEARKLGIGKLMPVRDALEKCPQLILVNGEDLTPYREMSYKVTELLGEFCPLVERLGLDENFVDITELVGKRFKELERSGNSQIHLSGHVYNQQALNLHDPTHIRLILGSQVAREFRESLKTRLGLTACAGIASNKFLAKLVSGIFKPDQQTLLLPENQRELLTSLDHIRKIPGIGSKTSERLEALGVRKVWELQDFPAALLEKEFGFSMAQRIRKLGHGEDDSPVIPWGPPQSFSDEDSFPKCSSAAEVKEKMEQLLPKLLERISKDGRRPHTLRLSIRRFSRMEKRPRRESRQCPIPPHLIPKLGSADVIAPLVELLLKLFGKMIQVEFPFHVTLLSVCFSNLKDLPGDGKGSMEFYLSSGKRERGSSSRECAEAPKRKRIPEGEENAGKKEEIPDFPRLASTSRENRAGMALPPEVDPGIFAELPADLQTELLAEWENREEGARFSMEKSLGKPKNAEGKRNPGEFSRSKGLLRYFKPLREDFLGSKPSG